MTDIEFVQLRNNTQVFKETSFVTRKRDRLSGKKSLGNGINDTKVIGTKGSAELRVVQFYRLLVAFVQNFHRLVSKSSG